MKIASSSKEKEQMKYPGKPIATEIKPATIFWPAEDYHQQVYRWREMGLEGKGKEGCLLVLMMDLMIVCMIAL